MRLYLIRHGQTTANLNKTFCGQMDVALTEEGRRQAESIRPILEKISFDKIYSSDLSRAIDTQRLALPGVEGERTPLLREFDAGSLEGLPYTYTREKYAGWSPSSDVKAYSTFGGESVDMVCDRLRLFLKSLETENYGNVAAFVHNGIMGCMLRIALNATFDRRAAQSNNCAINVFEYDGIRWKLLAWNYMSELD